MTNGKDEIGKTYGRLLVIKLADKRTNRKRHWLCTCSCGGTTVVSGTQLRNGKTQSCGCLVNETTRERNVKHYAVPHINGKRSPTTEYSSWQSMKDRCYNQNCKGYSNYGGRGIAVCERWKNSFENFLQDMGAKPTKLHMLERINNNGNYCPENCTWAVRTVQNKNRRNVRFYTYQGETLCLSDWARRFNMQPHTLMARIDRFGWTIEKALTASVSRGGAAHKRGSVKKR